MNVRSKIAAVAVGAVALGTLIGVGVSYADDPSTSPTPTAPASAAPSGQGHQADKAGAHAKRALLKRALHGEVTLGGKEKTRVIDFQRGAVQKVGPSAITLKSTDGFTATYVVNGETKVRKDGQPAKIGDIKAGDTVRVVARKDGNTSTARLVAEPKAR